MKFLMAILVYVLAGVVLGLGILRVMKGDPWLLLAGVLIYAVLLGTIGCLPKKSH